MDLTVWVTFTNIIPALLTLLIGLILLLIRFKAENQPTTQVQRWGPVLLAWLFIMNGLLWLVGIAEWGSGSRALYFILYDIPVIAPTFLLCFSLVFPQPIVRQSRIWLLFLFLAGIMVFVAITAVSANTHLIEVASGWDPLKDLWIYIGWMGSLIRWTQVYRKNRAHPEISLIASALIWGVLFHMVFRILIFNIDNVPVGEIPKFLVFGLDLRQFITIAFIILILHQLYERRRKWETAERLNLAMFVGAIVLYGLCRLFEAALGAGIPIAPLYSMVGYIVNEGGHQIIRPALILYALLRFQFFGHKLRTERYVIFLATLMIAYYGAYFLDMFSWSMGDYEASGAIGLVLFFVLLYPSFILAKKLIYKVIPSYKKMTRKDARDIYYISFYSALFRGRVEDTRDDSALKHLRKSLKITDREHNLLLESERMRVREGGPVNKIRHVIFVKDSGQHVASVGPVADHDETVLAGMLTAVRMFVKDAFAGATGDLDTIQYGDQKLLMEWERGYIMAIDLEGEFDPASRVIVGDLLAVIMRRHWRVLREWEGEIDLVQKVVEDLERLVFKYNKRGTL